MGSLQTSTLWGAAFRDGAIAGVALMACGCSLVLAPDGPSCQTRDDCEPMDGEIRLCSSSGQCISKDSIRWGCAVEPEEDFVGSVELRFTLQELVGRSPGPLANFTFQGCVAADVLCGSPTFITTDEKGKASLSVSRRNAYYVELVHPNPEIAPVTYHLGPFPNALEFADIKVTMNSWFDYSPITVTVPDYNPDLAHLSFSTYGCPGWDAAGVQFSLPDLEGSGAGPFYLLDNGLSSTATETGSEGRGSFINIDPGASGNDRLFTRVRAVEAATGLPLVETRALIRRGYYSIVAVHPLGNIPK